MISLIQAFPFNSHVKLKLTSDLSWKCWGTEINDTDESMNYTDLKLKVQGQAG